MDESPSFMATTEVLELHCKPDDTRTSQIPIQLKYFKEDLFKYRLYWKHTAIEVSFFCASFSCQNSAVMEVFWWWKLCVRKKCETEKNPLFFTNPKHWTWQIRPKPLLETADTCYKNPACFKKWKFVTNVVFYLKVLTIYYFAGENWLSFQCLLLLVISFC